MLVRLAIFGLSLVGLLAASLAASSALANETGDEPPFFGVCFPEDALVPEASESDCALTIRDALYYADNLPSDPLDEDVNQALRVDLRVLLSRSEACRFPLAGLPVCLLPENMDTPMLKPCFLALAERLRRHLETPLPPAFRADLDPTSLEQARRFLPGILTEFQADKPESTWLEQMLLSLLDALLRWLDDTEEQPDDETLRTLATGLSNLLYLAVMMVLGVLVYLLARRFLVGRMPLPERSILTPYGSLPGRVASRDLLQQAAETLAAGDRREGLRLYLLALLSHLVETELLHPHPWRTNRELLRDLEALAEIGPPLVRWLSRFDTLWYRGEIPDEDEALALADEAERTYARISPQTLATREGTP